MGIFKQKNTESKEFSKYVKSYLKNECEGDIFELTALTGFLIRGASKSKDDEFYKETIKCIAYVNKDNQVTQNEIRLFRFLDNVEPLDLLYIKDLTAYNFVVKKVKDKDIYYLLELKEIRRADMFDVIINEQTKVLSIKEENDIFTYDRTLDWYTGKVVIENKNISVMLCHEYTTLDATKSLNTFKIIKNDFKNFYHKVLSQCAKSMVVLANAWREDDDTHEITAEEIYKRIDGDFDIEIRDTNYSIYFNDDNIFYGHVILYNGNIENDKFDTTIAG